MEADPDVQASLNLTVTVCDFGWSNAGQALADMECTVSVMPVLIESTTYEAELRRWAMGGGKKRGGV